jgi:hypothetical protein
MVEITIDRVDDPWEVILFDPAGKQVNVQKVRRGNTVTMRFRPARQFANQLEDYTVAFRNVKKGITPDVTIQTRKIQ